MASTSTHLVILGGRNASGHLTDGFESSGRPAADLWVLPATAPANTFTKVTAAGNRPVARVNASMAGNDTRILLFGGSNPTLGQLADTWLFNPTTSTWTAVCSVPGTPVCSPGPLPRSGAGLTWDSNRKRFILFGGYRFEGAGISSADDTWEFDPTTLKWSLLCGASVGGSSCGIGLANDDAKIAYHAGRRRVVQAVGYSFGFRDYAYELYVRGGSCSSAADCDTGRWDAGLYRRHVLRDGLSHLPDMCRPLVSWGLQERRGRPRRPSGPLHGRHRVQWLGGLQVPQWDSMHRREHLQLRQLRRLGLLQVLDLRIGPVCGEHTDRRQRWTL
ncbi:MAG: hypothetical protein IPJ34_18795 [Myxococcales bacterium]|nr:hypothetical protein [Myxococcales bacterium]